MRSGVHLTRRKPLGKSSLEREDDHWRTQKSKQYTHPFTFFFLYLYLIWYIPLSFSHLLVCSAPPTLFLTLFSFFSLLPSTCFPLSFFFSFYLSLFSIWIDEFLHFLCFSLFLIPNFFFFFLEVVKIYGGLFCGSFLKNFFFWRYWQDFFVLH